MLIARGSHSHNEHVQNVSRSRHTTRTHTYIHILFKRNVFHDRSSFLSLYSGAVEKSLTFVYHCNLFKKNSTSKITEYNDLENIFITCEYIITTLVVIHKIFY